LRGRARQRIVAAPANLRLRASRHGAIGAELGNTSPRGQRVTLDERR
jgi:hypothetical protein